MLKFQVIYIVWCLTALAVAFNLREEDKKYVIKLAHRCLNKTGGPESDIQHFLARDIPQERSTKCLYACMSELFGMINKEGKPDPQALKDLAKLMFGENPDVQRVLFEIADECGYESDEDRCELAFKIMDCAEKAAAKRNINYRDIM